MPIKGAEQKEAAKAVYHLCPRCLRATPASANEHFCPNDGSKLLETCPHCHIAITSPYSRYCVNCGQVLFLANNPNYFGLTRN